MTLSSETLAELKRLEKERTDGGFRIWAVTHDYDTVFSLYAKEPEGKLIIGQVQTEADGDYVVAACNALPDLITEIEQQRAKLEKWRGLGKKMQAQQQLNGHVYQEVFDELDAILETESGK